MKDKSCSTCRDVDCPYNPEWLDEDMDLEERMRLRHIHMFTKLKGCASHLPKICNHPKLMSSDPQDPDCSRAICPVCGESFGWWCPKSPDGKCHYSKSFDSCDYCGNPEERK